MTVWLPIIKPSYDRNNEISLYSESVKFTGQASCVKSGFKLTRLKFFGYTQ